MDRVNNSSSSATNTSYAPTTCEAPPAEPQAVASCPDGSVAYDAGVCETTGLKGPPTATQRYLSSLADPKPPAGGAAAVSTPTSTADQASNASTVRQVLDASRGEAIAAIRAAIEESTLKGGEALSSSFALPNGCEVSFSVQGSLVQTGNDEPKLAFEVTGALEATFGVATGRVELSFSQSSTGEQSFAFEVCALSGVNAGSDNAVSAEALVGVCGKVKDGTSLEAEFELAAVAEAGVSLSVSELLEWKQTFESRTPLLRETLPFDVIP